MARGRARGHVARSIDIAMALAFVLVMSTALVEEVPHEYVGIALLVLVAAHLVLNRGYFVRLFRGRYTLVRVVRLVPIAGLVVTMAGQAVSSLVLSKHALWFLPTIPGAAWARRVHMLCSYWSFFCAFAHAGTQVPRRRRPALVRAAVALACAYGAVSFVRLDLAAYLTGRVVFAAADYSSPLVLTCARYASLAVLISTVAYGLRCAVTRGMPLLRRASLLASFLGLGR